MLHTGEDNRRLAQTQPRDRVRVVFNLAMPEARNVQVMGSFNGWRPQKCEVRKIGSEMSWSATLSLPPGRYEYVFLVDGEKIVSDPGQVLLQDDGFGNVNNVLVVGNGHEQSI